MRFLLVTGIYFVLHFIPVLLILTGLLLPLGLRHYQYSLSRCELDETLDFLEEKVRSVKE